MNNCKNCGNSVFDQVFGEYKCSVCGTRIYYPDLHINCSDWKKGEPVESKEDRDESLANGTV